MTLSLMLLEDEAEAADALEAACGEIKFAEIKDT